MAAWRFLELPSTDSTNEVARHVPPFTAVRADVQVAGRGQKARHWFSAPGGLWTSLVFPLPAPELPQALLALSIGAHLIQFFRSQGIASARLRFPNDLMIDRSKLGGLLIEIPDRERCIVGIGINLLNELAPAEQLRTPATRLSDHWPHCPSPSALLPLLIPHLENAFFAPCCPHDVWLDEPVRCRVDLPKDSLYGIFLGVSPSGNLLLRDDKATIQELPAPLIQAFQEIFED